MIRILTSRYSVGGEVSVASVYKSNFIKLAPNAP